MSATSIPGADQATMISAVIGRSRAVSVDFSGASVILTGAKAVAVFAAKVSCSPLSFPHLSLPEIRS